MKSTVTIERVKIDARPHQGPSAQTGEDAPNATLAALRRMWLPTYATATLVVDAWAMRQWGAQAALAVFALLLALPLAIYLMRSMTRGVQFWILTGGLLSAGIAALWAWAGPITAMGALGMGSVVWFTVKHRLKLRHLMILMALVAVFLRVLMGFGDALSVIALGVVVPVAIATGFTLLIRQASIEQEGFLSVLDMAARAGLPFGPAAAAFGGMCSPRYQRRLARVTRRLDRGDALPAAVAADPRTLAIDSRALVSLGWSTDTLPPTLEQAVASHEERARGRPLDNLLFVYPFVVCLAAVAAAGYYAFEVAPRFYRIANDQGAKMPPATEWLNKLTLPIVVRFNSMSLEEILVTSFAALCGIVLIASLVWALWVQGFGPPTPGRWLARRRTHAALLRGISVAAEAGRPLPEVLRQILRTDLRRDARVPWVKACDDVLRGRPLHEALRRAGIIGYADACVLESATRLGNLPWAVRTVAENLERRATRRLHALGRVYQLIALLAVSLAVVFVILAYFHPVVTMIMNEVEKL